MFLSILVVEISILYRLVNFRIAQFIAAKSLKKCNKYTNDMKIYGQYALTILNKFFKLNLFYVIKPVIILTGLLINIAVIGAEVNGVFYDFVVAKDNSGDFTSVQKAIDAVPHLRKNETSIFIKNGIYKEKLILPSTKSGVKMVGENKDSTILTYDDYASKKNRFGEDIGTSGSTSFFIYGDNFSAENLTFENSSGDVGQAVAVRIDGDKIMFKNCRFLGNQDTLYPHGKESRQYYLNCYIEGTVDFIFGWSTALFEECVIFGKRNGYFTAASTDEGANFGFVFKKCQITGSANRGSVYLGRPWRSFAKTVFIECQMDSVVHPVGWHNWGKKEAEENTYYGEYGSFGEGATINSRVTWSHQMSDADAKTYTVETIFNDWIPKK